MKESDLLADIYAAPEDDGPRLVYGDWLLTQGQEAKGELILAQCRQNDPKLTMAERRKLRAAENKLIKAAKNAAGMELARLLEVEQNDLFPTVKVEIERGFVQRIEAPHSVLQKLETLFAFAPLVDEITVGQWVPPDPTKAFPDRMPLDAKAFGSPLLAHLRALHVSVVDADDRTLGALAECKHLKNLRALSIVNTRWYDSSMQPAGYVLGAAGAKKVATSPHLANVKELRVSEGKFGDEGIAAFVAGTWNLESLDISNNDCTGKIFETIAEAEALDSLRRLAVRQSGPVSPEQAEALGSSKHLKNLVHLDIEKCDLRVGGVEAFFGTGFALAALKELIIASNSLGDAGGVALSKAKQLTQLELLDITKNRLGKKAVIALAETPHLSNLKKLLVNDRESAEAKEALQLSTTLAEAQVYYRGKLLAKD